MSSTGQSKESEALALAEEIVATKAKLAELMARFSGMVGAPSRHAPSAGPAPAASTGGRVAGNPAPAPTPAGPMPAAQHVLAVFKRRPNKVLSLQSVVDEVMRDPEAGATPELIRTAAARFARNAKGKGHGLRKAGRGKYRYVPGPQEAAH